MANFVTDGGTLPTNKVDAEAPGIPSTEYCDAADFNKVAQASLDIQAYLNFVTNLVTEGGDPTGAADSSAALAAACTAAASAGGVITMQPGVYKIAVNTTVPTGIMIAMDPGAIFSVSGGVTLTINGSIQATDNQQLFTGSGTVALGAIGVPGAPGHVSVKWFGAKGDSSTDDTAAIQATMSALGYMEAAAGATAGSIQRVFFPRGVYIVSTALVPSAFADLAGEQAILFATNPANNILHLTGYHVRINGLTFQGGLNALYVDNGDIDVNHVWVSECEFDGQNGAALADNNSSSTLVAFDKCLFYQAVSGAYAFNVISVRINASNCQFYWGTATCFNIYGTVYLRCTDCDGIPLGGNTQWINVTGPIGGGAQVYFERFRFGGESVSSICTWSGLPPLSDEPGVLSIKQCEIFAFGVPAFIFNSLPATLTLDENTGDLSLGVLYATGMSDENFIWSQIYRKTVEQVQDLAQGGYSSATDRLLIADERLHPALRSASGQPHASDLVALVPGASLSFATHPNATVSSGTNPFGGTLLVATSTATAASASVELGSAILAPLAAGLYTAVIEIELTGPATIDSTIAGVQRNNNLPSGRQLLNIPFVIDPLWVSPAAWMTSTAYSVGNYIANYGDIFKCVVAGTSASGGTGPAIDEPGTSISDGTTANTTVASGSNGVLLPAGTINVASTTGFASSGTIAVQLEGIGQYALVTYTGKTTTSFTGCTGGSGYIFTGLTVTQGGATWVCLGDQNINLGWTPVASGSVVKIGALRIFSGLFNLKTVNTICVGASAPSTGTWQAGDRLDFGAPSAGGQIGTVCVAGGTPGTWKSYGTISS